VDGSLTIEKLIMEVMETLGIAIVIIGVLVYFAFK
jgi:hypothetical protein